MSPFRLMPLALGFVLTLSASAQTFKIGTGSEARQLATVESNAEFETFTGRTAKVTGTLTVDRQKRTGSAVIEVDAASIDTGIPVRNEHMRSEQWLNTAKNPTIRFVSTQVRHTGGDNLRVTGRFTLNGVTRTITVNAKAKYIPESETTRRARFVGDVVHIQTSFNIKLSDYNIKVPQQAVGKVANTVKISLSAWATKQ